MDAVLPVAAVPERGEPRGMTMETGGVTRDVGRLLAGGGPDAALRQVAGIFEKAADMKGWCAADGTAFQSSKATGEQAQGICAASGRLSAQGTIEIEIDLVHAPETVSIHLGFLMRHFAVLVERARMLPSKPLSDGMCALRFGVSVRAVPLSPGREAALFDQIKAFDAAARALQQRISPSVDRGSLKTQYKDFAGVLAPVQPLGIDPLSIDPSVDLFIKDVIELLDAGHIVGQDRALKQLVHRLQTECLTRPAHQPVTYCAQGTPGTGKSQSAVLIAWRLNVPFVNIDAASMPDFSTACSQLLGAGRGIVMSHQPGRIEQVANHHCGRGRSRGPGVPGDRGCALDTGSRGARVLRLRFWGECARGPGPRESHRPRARWIDHPAGVCFRGKCGLVQRGPGVRRGQPPVHQSLRYRQLHRVKRP